jgi:hypothetical protein
MFHARTLRAIGQDLESHGITQFNLTSFENGYLVRAVPRTVERAAPQHRAAKKASPPNGHSNRPSEIEYTEQSIERFRRTGSREARPGEQAAGFF